MKTREQIESEIASLNPMAKDYDRPEETHDTILAAGAHDALRWALGLAESSISETIRRS